MHVHSTTGHMHVRWPSIGTLRDGVTSGGVSYCVTLRDGPGASGGSPVSAAGAVGRPGCAARSAPRRARGSSCTPRRASAWALRRACGGTRASGCTRGCACGVRRSSGWTLRGAGGWTLRRAGSGRPFGRAGSCWTLRCAAGTRTLCGGWGALRGRRMGSSSRLSGRGLLVVGVDDVASQEQYGQYPG
jgi:hypothetical protein